MTARIATDACHLYRVEDVVRGKFYLGKHRGRIQQGYWGSGKWISRHIKKYGKQDLRYEVLVIADEQYIYDLERRWITPEFLAANPNCLNLCPGGMGGNLGNVPHNKGKKASEETKRKQSLAKLGKPSHRKGAKHTPEAIAKINANHPRTPMSEAGRAVWLAKKIGAKQPLSTCPECGKMGGLWTMKRWHFDNCRHKEH
jgi:hypothetical protein